MLPDRSRSSGKRRVNPKFEYGGATRETEAGVGEKVSGERDERVNPITFSDFRSKKGWRRSKHLLDSRGISRVSRMLKANSITPGRPD